MTVLMIQEQSFIEAILRNTDDDTYRLVYADWLEERGDPRSEIIRLQCRIAGLPEDDRANLERFLQQSWAEQSNEWVEHCGLLLKWDSVLTLFKRRLTETAAWCDGQSPGSLRTPALQPQCLLSQFSQSNGVTCIPTIDARQRIVNALANRRAHLLSESKDYPIKHSRGLPAGRLVLFYPDDTLSDGAAEETSGGYFDVDNVPAWDTWVFYAEDESRIIHKSYLITWAPGGVASVVNSGIQVNPEECIRWAADVDTILTRKLREVGLLV